MRQKMEKLFNMIEEHGWRGRIVPIGHLTDLRHAIISRYERGLIDEKLYQDQLSFFSFDLPADLPSARSILIVAVPTPQMRIIFQWKGRRVPVIVPPTYISYTPRTESTQEILATWLKNEGYYLSKPQLPLKTLAVYSGLAKYGRNNICYVDGMGSFLQLVGAFSDLSCDRDPWQEPKKLNRCESCVACLQHCPTKAINNNRFLLHAENCLTYHNEAASDFPGWINPSWHHCLIGCLRCQTICPENKEVIKWFEDRAEFSEQETALFIQGVPFDQLPAEMVIKIKNLEINEKYRLLCRNLSMVIEQ
jgi:epoxyqueuosine reductase